MCMYVLSMYVCMYVYVCLYLLYVYVLGMYVYVCMCACMFICISRVYCVLVHVRVRVPVCVDKPSVDVMSLPLSLPSFVVRQDLSQNKSSPTCLDWLAI